MKIQHVKLGFSGHFLVVDGTRGPLVHYDTHKPATHPSGVISYLPYGHSDGCNNKALAGKVFVELVGADIERIEDTACEPANKARAELQEIVKTCTDVKLARYGAEAPAEGESP